MQNSFSRSRLLSLQAAAEKQKMLEERQNTANCGSFYLTSNRRAAADTPALLHPIDMD
jgi:hypothetical protein